MNKIKKGDEVIMIAGKDKGKRGKVAIVLVKDEKFIVEGINQSRKGVKPNPEKGIEGGFELKDMPIHRSNVMLYNPATQKGSKVGIRVLDDGSKTRYFKSTNDVVDV
jgi:large subunit ribosomal protein L24